MLTSLERHASSPEPSYWPTAWRLVYGTFYGSHFRPAVERALPPHLYSLRFHDLRHTYASILILLRKHPKVIQERMGHSSIQVTFDRYGHLLPGLDDDDEAVGELYLQAQTETRNEAKVLRLSS